MYVAEKALRRLCGCEGSPGHLTAPLAYAKSIKCSLRAVYTGAQLRHNDFRIFADPSRIFTYSCDETFKTTSRIISEKKCQVELIMVGHFFLPLIVDIVLKVITDSTPIIFIAIYSAITISLCLLAIRFPMRFHK